MVDDDPGMRALLARAARHAGLEPFEAGSLNAALLRAHEVLPMGVVTDWDLGDGHGGQLFELLKERLGEELPGILITARAEELENDDRFDGTYADFGYEQFTFEVLVGTEPQFTDSDEDYRDGETRLPYDTVRARREREEDERDDDDDEDEVEEPYETIRIRVQFPAIKEYKSELTLEQWMEWRLIHGEPEGEEGDLPGAVGGAPGAGQDDR